MNNLSKIHQINADVENESGGGGRYFIYANKHVIRVVDTQYIHSYPLQFEIIEVKKLSHKTQLVWK